MAVAENSMVLNHARPEFEKVLTSLPDASTLPPMCYHLPGVL